MNTQKTSSTTAIQINLKEPGLYELPILANPVQVDLTADGEYVLLYANLDLGDVPPESNIVLRFPIHVAAAMQWLASLEQLRKDQELALPDVPVQKNSMH